MAFCALIAVARAGVISHAPAYAAQAYAAPAYAAHSYAAPAYAAPAYAAQAYAPGWSLTLKIQHTKSI